MIWRKKVSRTPDKFGTGQIEGVAAPEAANNATSSAGFIPLLALGIPASPPLAVLVAALMIYGVAPGPTLFQQQPDFVWTVIASMFVGNAMLLVLNLPLVGLWARLVRIPYGILAPLILLLCFVGSYSVRNSLFDVWTTLAFGVLGYLLYRTRWPVIPFILCFILGPLLEQSLLQSLAMSSGSPWIFFQRPLALTLMGVAGVLLLLSLWLIRRTKQRVQEAVGEPTDLQD